MKLNFGGIFEKCSVGDRGGQFWPLEAKQKTQKTLSPKSSLAIFWPPEAKYGLLVFKKILFKVVVFCVF